RSLPSSTATPLRVDLSLTHSWGRLDALRRKRPRPASHRHRNRAAVVRPRRSRRALHRTALGPPPRGPHGLRGLRHPAVGYCDHARIAMPDEMGRGHWNDAVLERLGLLRISERTR